MQKSNRRKFLKVGGLSALGWSLMPSMNSLFAQSRQQLLEHNIPIEKGLDPEWIKSLYERGVPTRYSKTKNELQYLGMPVGGLHAGTVYLGGDGRLWLWQVFNDSYDGIKEGIEPKNVKWNNGKEYTTVRPRDGAVYVDPAIADNLRVMEQGFAIETIYKNKKYIKELRESHWDEIIFEPTYPTCKITYSSKDCPVEVELVAFSPFIPLDNDNSALPLTTLHLTLKNKSAGPLDIVVSGWMENGIHKGRKSFNEVQKLADVSSDNAGKMIFFSTNKVPEAEQKAGDHGTMAFGILDKDAIAVAEVKNWPIVPSSLLHEQTQSTKDFNTMQVASLTVTRQLQPGETTQLSYAISWHFNNPHPKLQEVIPEARSGYWFGTKFKDAQAVLEYYITNSTKLNGETLSWQRVWNDSTLPHWFLDRTFLNISTLATANTYRFASGRLWGWEGVGACAGTCTHVWQYGQAMGRIFPALERNLRETTDLKPGVGFVEDTGAILFRAEYADIPAIDGQAGVVLRFYREHQMSKDDSFLKRNWSNLKKAIAFIIAQDKDRDGMLDTKMENTLDAKWDGAIAWLVGLCISAVKAAELMAIEMGDKTFAQICASYVNKGQESMDKELFNGEYYIHKPDPVLGRKNLGSYNTCHIDQVYGQAWALQVGMPRINKVENTLSALRSLWKYNFTPDVGPYIKTHLGGRPYALPGEGGMIMNTNPKNEKKPYGENVSWQLGYFHECMSGFEHQVAAHMMGEGMVDEALILTRAIHDRYHGAKRNPFNEIECSDHYARAMASYGTFITACGFEYHGPRGYIRFAPKWNKQKFKAPFTTAEGWGSYEQTINRSEQMHSLIVKYGQLSLKQLSFEKLNAKVVSVKLNNQPVAVGFSQEGKNIFIDFKKSVVLQKDQKLIIKIA